MIFKMRNENDEIQKSLERCYELTRRSQSSFFPSFGFLAAEKRQAMMVIYAFNRFTDDLIDSAPESTPTAEKHALLDDWQAALHQAMEASPSLSELLSAFPRLSGVEYLPALRFIADRFGIPKPIFSEVIRGVRADIAPVRFSEYEDADDYCHQVATSVGIASLAIWGTKEPLASPQVAQAAKACGLAVQWTNIVRDLKEDLRERNRCYFPQSELRLAGITEEQLIDLIEYETGDKLTRKNVAEEDFAKYDRFIERQLDRIEANFLMAADLYPKVNQDARRSFGMIWDTYYRLYQKIRRHPRKILSQRIRLGTFEKLRLFCRWKIFLPKKLPIGDK